MLTWTASGTEQDVKRELGHEKVSNVTHFFHVAFGGKLPTTQFELLLSMSCHAMPCQESIMSSFKFTLHAYSDSELLSDQET